MVLRYSESLDNTIPKLQIDTILIELESDKAGIYDVSPHTSLTTFPCNGARGVYGVQPIDSSQRQELDTLYASAQNKLANIAVSGAMQVEQEHKKLQLEQALTMRRELLLDTGSFWPVDSSARTTIASFLRDAQGVGRHQFETSEDYESFTSQAAGFSDWVDRAIATMQDGISQADTPSQYTIDKAIKRLAGYLENDGKAVKDAVAPPLKKNVLSEQQKDIYQQTVTNALLPEIQRAYDYLRNRYVTACRPDNRAGLCHIPDGVEQYDRLMRYHLCDTVSADEVYDLAQEQYHKLSKDLEVLLADTGVSSPQVFEWAYNYKAYPEYAYDSVERIIQTCQELAGAAHLENIFMPENIPERPYSLHVITDHTAQTTSPMYDNYVFSLPINEPREYTPAYLQELYIHEAIGHHVGNNNHYANMPPFLRDVKYGAVREGWAMYVESLAKDMDIPELSKMAVARSYPRKIGAAVFTMLDIQINQKGWTLDRARQFLKDKLPGSDYDSDGNMARLLAWPGQGLVYIYGEQAFHQMRQAAEAKQGARFDLREFHQKILTPGEAPFAQLYERVLH